MYSLLVAAVTSVAVALLVTPLFRNLAVRLGWVDKPDSKRKTHSKPIPRVGGIPIFIAYLAAFALLLLLHMRAGIGIRSHLDLIWRIFPAAGLVFLVGLLDDIFDLRPWHKLVAQALAAMLVFASGIHLSDISGVHLQAWWTFPVTVVWLVGCSNAFNLIDGVDGLSAGIGLFATITTLLEALLRGNVSLALATVPLAGALLGFLRYNSNPATIYLGDSGSLLIGFLLGCFGILWSGKSATVLGMTAPLMLLAIPLMDTALAIVRRYLRNQPLFGADRGHIHHKLLARGFTPRRVVYLMYGVCSFGAFLSLLQSAFHERFGGVIVLVFCAAVCLGIRYLGYAEFEAARRIVFSGAIRQRLHAELELVTLCESLTDAGSADACWDALKPACNVFGFGEVRLKLAGRTYLHCTSQPHVPNAWALRIELSDSEYLNLYCKAGSPVLPVSAMFADTVGRALRAKVVQLRRLIPTPAREVAISYSAHSQAASTAVEMAG